jgi:hypothetical protein
VQFRDAAIHSIKLVVDESLNRCRIEVVGFFASLPTEARQAVKEALTGAPLNRPDVLDEIESANVVRVDDSRGEQRRRAIVSDITGEVQGSQ